MTLTQEQMDAVERYYPIAYPPSKYHGRSLIITKTDPQVDVWDVLIQMHQDVQVLQGLVDRLISESNRKQPGCAGEEGA